MSHANRGCPTDLAVKTSLKSTQVDSLVEAMPCGRELQTPGGPWPPCCNCESQAWLLPSVAQLGAAGKAALVAESSGRAVGPTRSSQQWEADLEPKED